MKMDDYQEWKDEIYPNKQWHKEVYFFKLEHYKYMKQENVTSK